MALVVVQKSGQLVEAWVRNVECQPNASALIDTSVLLGMHVSASVVAWRFLAYFPMLT